MAKVAEKATNQTMDTDIMTVFEEQKVLIKAAVRSYYDTQKLRIAIGNRIAGAINLQMGQEPGKKQEDLDKEAQKIITKLRGEYKRITDAYVSGTFVQIEGSGSKRVEKQVALGKCKKVEEVISKIRSLGEHDKTGIELITDKRIYDNVSVYGELLFSEEKQMKMIADLVKEHPMWNNFFLDVKGCGPLMAAVCLASFDIGKARHVSSFWKYAGLDVINTVNEKGEIVESKANGKWYTEKQDYIKKDGTVGDKLGLTYNPELRVKLLGVLGSSILKACLRPAKNEDGTYRLDEDGNKIFDRADGYAGAYVDYLARLNHNPDKCGYSSARKNNMAIRYMIKQFVRDMWVVWREMAGFEVSTPYEVAFLGRKPHKWNEYHAKQAAASVKANVEEEDFI